LTAVQKTILNPAATRAMVPQLSRARNPNVWVYRYAHPSGWRLSIATLAEPGSDKLSLGGFRIAPAERTDAPGFDSDIEAIELAMGMEEKVYWSRIIGVGGPLARRDMNRIVGGKCVLHPTTDARVGMPRDRELLDFATASLIDCDMTAGIRITTGQDLGHGLMSDGQTGSLEYLHRGFRGSVVADTSRPTGEGNYFVLRGMLRAFGIALSDATVGLIGAGNIGLHVFDRIRAERARVLAIEPRPERREMLEQLGATTCAPEEKPAFLAEPMDALVLNASGGSLDTASVRTASGNRRLRVICGSENLVMPEERDAEAFRASHKAYCPTELGGMMGYLTAVEEYLAELERLPFEAEALLTAAAGLEEPAYRATSHMIDTGFALDFEAAMEAVSAGQASRP
jgi:hypothetical protein